MQQELQSIGEVTNEGPLSVLDTRSRRFVTGKVGGDVIDDGVQADLGLPADRRSDLLDGRNAPLHVLEPFAVNDIIRYVPDLRAATRARDHPAGQLADCDLLCAANIEDVSEACA